MNKPLLTFLLGVILSLNLTAQNRFEKGFVVTGTGDRIEGLIKNMDWNNAPTQIEFRTEENSPVKSYNISNIKEFEIHGRAKYVKAEVDMDTSSDEINSLSEDENPVFSKQTVFLKTIVEGKYTLYKYSNENVKRFFYQTDGQTEPLIFKRYLISDSKIAKNNKYLKQLQGISGCEKITSAQLSNVEYRESDLKALFIKFNSCGEGSTEYKSFDHETNKKFFHLSVRPGINFSSLDIKNKSPNNVFDSDYGSKNNFRIGLEAEFVLPFNNNKWAIIVEPTYQYFKADQEVFTTTILGDQVSNKASLKYLSVEVPLGLRYYAFLNSRSKLFFNAAVIFDIPMGDSKLTYNIHYFAQDEFKMESSANFGLGIGYKYNDRYSVEFNMHTKRNFLKSGQNDTAYQNFSIILGYTLF